MKKILIGMLVAAMAVVTGCKPTVEQMKTTATAIGYAAGLVANEVGIKDDARNAIVNVLNEVRECVPAEGQSFTEAWTPVIKEKVAALIAEGKIDASTGEIVTTTAILAAKGVDYLFDVRFPEARQYSDLVAAGVAGAVDGFLTVFKPVNCEDCSDAEPCDNCTPRARAAKEFDKEAYEWLRSHK